MLKKKKSLKYCCVCKGMYRGKVLDGRTVSLHRFPQNKRLKRVWIQRCRTVLKNFQWTENRLLCSEHFVDRKGPSSTHTIPSIFPTASGTEKIFPYSALDENDQPQEDIQEEMFTATPLVVNDVPVVVSETNEQEKYENQSIIQENHHSNLDVSLIFHDYTNEPISAPSAIRMVETQTCLDYCTSETQTDLVRTCVSVGTQTCSVECRDSGEQTNLPTLVYEDVKDHPSKLNFYTGIPNKGIFNALFDEMGDMKEERPSRCKRPSGGRPRALRLVDEFFMVLLRLRLGLLVDDLAARFCISSTACSRLLNKWIDYLDVKLNFLIMWPVKSVVDFNMPKLFRDKFPDTRVIIDCTEIKTETPSSLQLKSLMYSDYKSHITWKSLVGISPSGHVTFVSDLWVGSISDKKLTEKCGILDLCEEGDAIMADKGFLISDLTTPRGIKLIMPPFKRGKSKFSKREVKATRDIANARIHVERQMERIKNFRIVQGIMPITMSLRASKVWKLCAKLTNLQPPLVPH